MTENNGNTKKLVVMYADIRGSSVWTRRMSEDHKGRHAFWFRYDVEMLRFRVRSDATFYKRLGDGRLFVWEIFSNERAIAERILRESLVLYDRVYRLIDEQSSPRPGGIRIRKMVGVASKEEYPDGEIDYLGYVANTCHKLLLVEPQIGEIVHENFKEIITRGRSAKGLTFARVTPKYFPDGVDREDMEALFSVTRRRRGSR